MRNCFPSASKFFLILFFSLFSKSNWGQNMITKSNADSSITITQDIRLDDLIKRQKNSNAMKQTMPGYRIQIYFGGVRQKASEIQMTFKEKHNDVAAYIAYQQPNFKVRVGDFRTRLEAQKFLKSMEGEYATMFIVQDEVKLPVIK